MKAFFFLVPVIMLTMSFLFMGLVITQHRALFLIPETACLIAYIVSMIYACRRNPK